MTDEERAKGIELVTAATLGQTDELRRLLSTPGYDVHYENDLPLRAASYTGYNDSMKLLVEQGANVNAVGAEVLLYAAKRRDADAVAYLLSKGADAELMLRIHSRDVDQAARETLEQQKSDKLRDSFEKNHARIKRPADIEKYRLRKRPPSP